MATPRIQDVDDLRRNVAATRADAHFGLGILLVLLASCLTVIAFRPAHLWGWYLSYVLLVFVVWTAFSRLIPGRVAGVEPDGDD